MRVRGRAVAALLALAPLASGCVTPPDSATVLASAGGTGPGDAFVVATREQEFEILRLLGLRSDSRMVHAIDGKRYDVFATTDPRTGEAREVWFDISRFLGRS